MTRLDRLHRIFRICRENLTQSAIHHLTRRVHIHLNLLLGRLRHQHCPLEVSMDHYGLRLRIPLHPRLMVRSYRNHLSLLPRKRCLWAAVLALFRHTRILSPRRGFRLVVPMEPFHMAIHGRLHLKTVHRRSPATAQIPGIINTN